MSGLGRIVILSDTHLGKPRRWARSAGSLEPLLEGACRLVINGDVAEVHDTQHRADAAREVIALQSLCDGRGVELTLIAGNHDPFIAERRSLRLFEEEVTITHGDVLHPAIAPWAQEADRLRELYDQTMQAALAEARGRAITDETIRLEAARYASHFYWCERNEPSGAAGNLFMRGARLARLSALAAYYWVKLPQSAFTYAAFHAPNSRFFIFGHIHRAGVWERHGRVVINTGSFDMPGRPRGVVIEDGVLSVRAIKRAGDSWRWGAKTHASYQLERADRVGAEPKAA